MTDTSSTGPTWDDRVKPDIAAPSKINYVLDADANQGAGAYTVSGTGTSFAAPVAAGSAAIFKDWLIYAYGTSFANNPRRILVNLLNFGDRKNASSTGSQYFSNFYGAGRLRMRLPETKAMDAPYRWITGNVTLSDGQSQQVWLGPVGNVTGPIDDAVNFLKIALWWHEPNTAPGQTKALISGRLFKETAPGSGFYIYTLHDSNGDQKVHFIYDDLEANFADFDGNRRYYFRIVADSIPGSETRTVYYSALWEDLSRDDADGPCYSCGPTDDKYLLYR